MDLKYFIESQQVDHLLLYEIFELADRIRQRPFAFAESLKGKVLATLFYEPSTRTRLSFESAMLKLGGQVVSTENAKEFSSAVKGESIEDTARIVSAYADAIVIRHYLDGAAKKAAEASSVPVINAGDGKGQHPTQALLDVYTIYSEFGSLCNLKIALVGDLASGRTVRSLCYLLGKVGKNIEFIFVSPQHLKMGQDIKDYLTKHEISFREEEDLSKVLPIADVIYMTRIQKERMSLEEYEQAKGKYVLNMENLGLVRAGARIMHPLPHVEELDFPFDVEQKDLRIAYFREAANGLYVRMALLQMMLKERE